MNIRKHARFLSQVFFFLLGCLLVDIAASKALTIADHIYLFGLNCSGSSDYIGGQQINNFRVKNISQITFTVKNGQLISFDGLGDVVCEGFCPPVRQYKIGGAVESIGISNGEILVQAGEHSLSLSPEGGMTGTGPHNPTSSLLSFSCERVHNYWALKSFAE